MTTATYRISTDYLFNENSITPSYAGRTFRWDGYETGPAHRVTLIDDDGITYYTGFARVSDEDLDEFIMDIYDWFAYDSGTTLLRLDGKDTIG